MTGRAPGWTPLHRDPPPPDWRRLRPLRLGDFIEALTSLYRRHWRLVFAVAALVEVPLAVVNGILLVPLSQRLTILAEQLVRAGQLDGTSATSGGADSAAAAVEGLADLLPAVFALTAALVAVSGIAAVILLGALSRVVARLYAGERASLRDAYGTVFARLAALLASSLLVTLAMVVVVVVWAAVATVLGALAAEGIATGRGGPAALLFLVWAVILVAFLLFLSTRWALVTPVIVLERVGPVRALGRSWRLVAGSTWRVLGLALLFTIVASVLSGTVAEFLNAVVGSASRSLEHRIAISAVVSALAQTIFGPILPAFLTLLYFDLRVRREGFDLPRAGAADADAGAPSGGTGDAERERASPDAAEEA